MNVIISNGIQYYYHSICQFVPGETQNIRLCLMIEQKRCVCFSLSALPDGLCQELFFLVIALRIHVVMTTNPRADVFLCTLLRIIVCECQNRNINQTQNNGGSLTL